MKKLKLTIISVLLVFAMIFAVACGGDSCNGGTTGGGSDTGGGQQINVDALIAQVIAALEENDFEFEIIDDIEAPMVKGIGFHKAELVVVDTATNVQGIINMLVASAEMMIDITGPWFDELFIYRLGTILYMGHTSAYDGENEAFDIVHGILGGTRVWSYVA